MAFLAPPNPLSGSLVAQVLRNLLVGGMILAAAYTGGETQTAMNNPASVSETTGSGGSTATMPAPIRQRP